MNSKELDQFYSTLKAELSKDDALEMPVETEEYLDIHELLDNTDPKHIYLSSDWHFFKNHYKKEANYVNTQKILTWCRQNIKPNDVFMFLGDISFRYANEEDKKESQRLMASIPGIKVLILGNHDVMAGDEYYTGCGFHYVYERLDWKNIVFTHRPISMEIMPEDYINIHGHIHKWTEYNTTDGKRNINVYPYFYDNKPVTLDYCLKHKDKLVKDNVRSDWVNMGESAEYRDIEDLDITLETSRSDLKDNQFGIPEDRKFPLDSEKHVMSAIKLFGHAEESKKKALAKRIKTAAKKYDIRIPETTQVYKYLSEAVVDKIDIPAEVENIVFDMGGVLVDSDTLDALKACEDIPTEYCEEIYDIIGKKFFFEKENPNITNCDAPKAKQYFISIVPDYIKPYTDIIFDVIGKAMYKFRHTDDLIDAFRSRGYKVYYLSNWERCFYELERDFFEPLLEKFDGGLFSYECNIEKPSLSIYKLFTDKFNLEPNKCLFFDDKQENIDAAKACSWHAELFDTTTPFKILKTLYSTHHVSIPDADVKKKIPALMQDGLEYINSSRIKFWYISDERNPKNVDKSDYCETIDCSISNHLHDSDFEEDYILYVTKYVFTIGKNDEPVCLGSIIVFRDESWEWFIQYPFIVDGGGQLKDGTKKAIDEWAMAAMNPVVGITKPYVLKMCNDCGDLINANRYALATDLVADKYLVINENANLEIVEASNISDMIVEQYEFVGDKRLIKKIEEAYYTGKIVDNTFFYTALTGKPMLSEDQIDFDPNFKKVDFIAMKENSLTKLATLNEGYINIITENSFKVDTITNNHTKQLIGNKSYLSIKKDISGYYVFNKENYKRSASVEEQNFITEQMINSVL